MHFDQVEAQDRNRHAAQGVGKVNGAVSETEPGLLTGLSFHAFVQRPATATSKAIFDLKGTKKSAISFTE